MSSIISKKGFWAQLERPIMALAPVADITDAVYRRLVARCGKPDVIFTEFVSVDGLCSPGRKNLLQHLRFDESEHPIVAQFFGTDPEKFRECARLAVELGFDGVDINMGCPVKVICKQGAGAALINEPELTQEIVQATIEGAGDLPVSVKTRIGFSTIDAEQWASTLLEANPAAIIFHLRTRKQMYRPSAHWEVMPGLVELARGTGVLIIGNGDIQTLQQAEKVAAETGVDGVMMGRAALGNPWLFRRTRQPETITLTERLDTLLEHAALFEAVFGFERSFVVMRKHLMAYASGFSGAKELRVMLQDVRCRRDVELAVAAFRSEKPQ